jgi:hypothetical protein
VGWATLRPRRGRGALTAWHAAVLGGGAAWAVARSLDGVDPLLGLLAGGVVLAVVVGAVALLTDLPTGRDVARAAAADGAARGSSSG